MNGCCLTGKPHVLVIDDNEDILTTLYMILKIKSYRVTVKMKVDNVETLVKKVQPDLILLDKNLGWADGCDLCTLIKQNDSLRIIPVIMFSAYNRKKEECISAGADDFIEKPFEMIDLLNRIAGLTGR